MKRSGLFFLIIIILLLIGCYYYNNYNAKKYEDERNKAIAEAVKQAIDSVNLHKILEAPVQIPEIHKPVEKVVEQVKKIKEPVKEDNVLIDERDGQKYPIVEINGKTWMAQNLNFKTNDSWCFDNETDECNDNGRLYTWNAAMKACPPGWKLPDDNDWNSLFDAFGGIHYAGDDLKDRGKSGFNVIFSGYRDKRGYFGKMDESAYFWSSSEQNDTYASFKGIYKSVDNIGTYTYPKQDGFSVRCVKE